MKLDDSFRVRNQPIAASQIPASLRNSRQWVNYSWPQKVPLSPRSGTNASSTNPETWGSLDEAIAANPQRLGFMLQPEEERALVFLDLDNVRHPESGELLPMIEDLVRRLSTHTHVSPSGTGLHLLFYVRGGVPGTRKRISLAARAPWADKNAGVEVYDRQRYLTFTTLSCGVDVSGEIEDRTDVFHEIYQELFGPPPPSREEDVGRAGSERNARSLSDAAVIGQLRRDEKGRQLWDGQWPSIVSDEGTPLYPSCSEADRALFLKLAHHTSGDVDQMMRLANQSPHKELHDRHEKWARLLQEECDSASNFWREQAPSGADRHGDPASVGELGQALLGRLPLATDGDFREPAVFLFEHGCYRPATQFPKLVTEEIERVGGRWSSRLVNEVAKWLVAKAPRVKLEEAPPADRVNVENGILDLTGSTPSLGPQTPTAWPWSVQLRVDYDPGARCPAIDAFIESAVPPDCVDLVWEIIGWSLAPTPGIQRWVLLQGEGGGGKSTLCNIIQAVLGPAAVSSVSLPELEHKPFLRAQLRGKLANIATELPDRSIEQSAVLKALTGDDTITVDIKYKDPISFRPFAHLIFTTNHDLKTSDVSMGFRRRLVIVPFPFTFPPAPEFSKTLLTPGELSGALSKALEARRRLLARGDFQLPESAQEAVEDAMELSDDFATRVSRYVEPGGASDSVPVSELQECLAAPQSGVPKLGRRKLFERLRNVPGFERTQLVHRQDSGSRFYELSGVRRLPPGPFVPRLSLSG